MFCFLLCGLNMEKIAVRHPELSLLVVFIVLSSVRFSSWVVGLVIASVLMR